ncbi:MAG TPA: DUF433 domain-containing protein [Ktedonobacterales bacterium]|nr:DUF433 domain-containing protein [Ktedonobacterales bacterium]
MTHSLDMPGVFSNPEIHGGQPVVATGIPIYLILDMLAQGFSRDEMLSDYGITEEHIRIALRFASEYLKRDGSDAA